MGQRLSIVIVTKDTKDLLDNLLTSISNDGSLAPVLADIIVVDNASSDGTDALLGTKFPAVTHVRNETNEGFSRAVNRGVAIARGPYILFLNSDTILIDGETIKMVRFMDTHDSVGICGPQLVYPDMELQRSTAAVPSVLSELVPGLLRRGFEPKARPGDSIEVPSLIGAAVLTRKKALDDLGGFDERFFFFLEETDLCVRMRGKGYGVVFLPEVRIVHLQGKTVRKNWIRGRMEYGISLYKFISKHHGWLYYAAFVGLRLGKAIMAAIFLSLVFVVLFGRGTRMRWMYYLKLTLWHFRGCPDNAGLREG